MFDAHPLLANPIVWFMAGMYAVYLVLVVKTLVLHALGRDGHPADKAPPPSGNPAPKP